MSTIFLFEIGSSSFSEEDDDLDEDDVEEEDDGVEFRVMDCSARDRFLKGLRDLRRGLLACLL